jgi:hypothetical protein
VITGELALARLRDWLRHAARNLAEPPRRRPYQLAAAHRLLS